MFTAISNRVNTLLLVLLVLMAGAIIAILATRASGGPLDPPGPPATTMHTLDDTAPVWDQRLNSTNGSPGVLGATPAGCDSDRFKCVMTYQQCASFCVTIYRPRPRDGARLAAVAVDTDGSLARGSLQLRASQHRWARRSAPPDRCGARFAPR
jgi:hypothetical protein